jgi:hypothetical protein
MPQLANILHDVPTATQAPLCSPAPPPTNPSSSSSSTENFPYLRYDAATRQILEARAAAKAAGEYGAPHATALYTLVRGRVTDRTTGIVKTTEKELAREQGVSRWTIWRTNKVLVEARVVTIAYQHDPKTGERCGLRYTVLGTAYGADVHQHPPLPFKSGTSSGAIAPPSTPKRPDEATTGQVRLSVRTVLEKLENSGEVVPCQPDLSVLVRQQLAALGWSTSEATIRDAVAYVLDAIGAKRRRELDDEEAGRHQEQRLPLVRLVTRRVAGWIRNDPSVGAWLTKQEPEQAIAWLLSTNDGLTRDEAATVLQRLDPAHAVEGVPDEAPQRPRKTRQAGPRRRRGAGDRSVVAAWAQRWASAPVSTDERDRRRLADEQLRAEVVAAVQAQPPDAAAALRSVVRPALAAHMRRCPGLTDRDRPKLEHDAIVVAVLQELRGQSIAETIAALIADVHRRSATPPIEASPDVAAHLADLRRRVAG